MLFGLSHTNGIKMLTAARRALAGVDVPVVQRYQREIDPNIVAQQAEAAFLNSATKATDRIYVFGDPRIILWSDRRYALVTTGWSWEMMPQSLWDELPRQLQIAAPTYVLVSDYYLRLIYQRSPRTLELLNTTYELTDLNGQALYHLKGR
jgi:hypothetical protein